VNADFQVKDDKLSTRLFVEFERRGLREYSSTVLGWKIPEKRRDADASHGKGQHASEMAGLAQLCPLVKFLWSNAVWWGKMPRARKTPGNFRGGVLDRPLTLHSFRPPLETTAPGLASRLPYPKPSDRISSAA